MHAEVRHGFIKEQAIIQQQPSQSLDCCTQVIFRALSAWASVAGDGWLRELRTRQAFHRGNWCMDVFSLVQASLLVDPNGPTPVATLVTSQ